MFTMSILWYFLQSHFHDNDIILWSLSLWFPRWLVGLLISSKCSVYLSFLTFSYFDQYARLVEIVGGHDLAVGITLGAHQVIHHFFQNMDCITMDHLYSFHFFNFFLNKLDWILLRNSNIICIIPQVHFEFFWPLWSKIG